MKPLEPRDTSILMAMAMDELGTWDDRAEPFLSKQARAVALALRKGATGRTAADRAARGILDSVRPDRKQAQ